MARVTVEDCVLKVTNRFKLVMLASHRVRAISAGEEVSLEKGNDKNSVVALREIAEDTLSVQSLEDSLIRSLQTNFEYKDIEDEESEPSAVELDSFNRQAIQTLFESEKKK